ncbi:hypothetical protein CES86_3575 [Brucella lupini]|uniref:Uncharacterized protein n=1 Tax=Brucella lupini TaxID=255457 RepID=A0A256GIE0_9HYPH|nr:hypothetical protein CES86_3575 [Brucella lupini]
MILRNVTSVEPGKSMRYGSLVAHSASPTISRGGYPRSSQT